MTHPMTAAPADRPHRSAQVGLAAWCAGLVLCGRALLWLGAGPLSIPITSPADLPAWAAQAQAPDLAVALLWAAGLAACAYLLAVTVAGVLARLLRLVTLAAALDRVTPALARRLVIGGSTAGLVVGALAGAAPLAGLPGRSPSTVTTGAAAPRTDAVATMVGEGPGPGASRTDHAEPTAVMTGLPPAAPAPTGDDTEGSATMTSIGSTPNARAEPPASTVRAPSARPAPPPPPPALPALDPTTWEVGTGDSLWSVAEEVVLAGAPDAGERAVARYWRRLVAANRAQLVDPDNPDLLVPGQRLVLP